MVKSEWDIHSADDIVICMGDFNGHDDRHLDGFDGVDGGYCVAERNLEGRMSS